MTDASAKTVQSFLKQLMDIQRKYANEQKNSKTNRQEEVRALLDKIVAKEVVDAD